MAPQPKIGIITFSRSLNYGSVLQAYATVRKLGEISKIRCEIIDFTPESQKTIYSLYLKGLSPRTLTINLSALISHKIIIDRQKKFARFFGNFLPMSAEKYSRVEDIAALDDHYSLCISGSDQIWNPANSDFSEAFLLPGLQKARRASYATSFGGTALETSDDMKRRFASLLSEYSLLGVRENSAITTVQELTGRTAEYTLDPTFLLTAEQWNEVASPTQPVKHPYIFFYSTNYNGDAMSMAREISRRTKLPIVTLYTSRKSVKARLSGYKFPESEAPEDFLALIRDATLVLTNSFHGCAFSLIYRKPFYMLRNEVSRINPLYDNRLQTLIDRFGLEDHAIYPSTLQNTKIGLHFENEAPIAALDAATNSSLEYLIKVTSLA